MRLHGDCLNAYDVSITKKSLKHETFFFQAGGSISDKLLKVTVPLVEEETCKDDYNQYTITEAMICAGETGRDSCQGDSGGPMTALDEQGNSVSHGFSRHRFQSNIKHVFLFRFWLELSVGASVVLKKVTLVFMLGSLSLWIGSMKPWTIIKMPFRPLKFISKQ